MDVAGEVGAAERGPELEEAAGEGGEQAAGGAAHPAREGGDGDAEGAKALVFGPGCSGGVGVGGRGDEALDLVADEMADLVEEALFGDRGALVEAASRRGP
jgi:hypothetical protein